MPSESMNSPEPDAKQQKQQQPLEERTMDPRDLVYNQGTPKNPREVLANPAVTPETIEDADNLRSDRQYDRDE